MHSKTCLKGFTLIEIMIVVAIIAIVAAIAFPAYQDSVRKSRRADARAVLLEAAQFMERFYTANFCYSNQRNAAGCAGAAVALPAALTVSPRGSAPGTQYYNIQFAAGQPTATTFRLDATPQGAQSGDTGCGTLSLTNTGQKIVSGTKPVDECWR